MRPWFSLISDIAAYLVDQEADNEAILYGLFLLWRVVSQTLNDLDSTHRSPSNVNGGFPLATIASARVLANCFFAYHLSTLQVIAPRGEEPRLRRSVLPSLFDLAKDLEVLFRRNVDPLSFRDTS